MKTMTEKNKERRVSVFSAEDNQCIWMKAGVINFKLCENAYDCLGCPFDKAMTKTAGRNPESMATWRQAMKGKEYAERVCRHMLTDRVQYRLCSNNYRCNVCEFDQALDEADLSTAMGAVHTSKTMGFQVADGYYYHKGHSWARVEHGGFVRIGMDDFALRLLGRPTDIRLPKLGSQLEQTEEGWAIQRGDKTAKVLSPMTGVVLATNHKAVKHPEAAKTDPYREGWLMVVEPLHLKRNLKNLFFEQETRAWLGAEVRKLDDIVTSVYGLPLAATGGEIVDDIFGNLPDVKWEDLVHEFLLT